MDARKTKRRGSASTTCQEVPSQVFEITDYTTASDWERFISALEDILTQWNLNKQAQSKHDRPLKQGAVSKGRWFERCDTIKFGVYSFDLKYRWLDPADDDLYDGKAPDVEPDYLQQKYHDQIVTGVGDDYLHRREEKSSETDGSDNEFQDCCDDREEPIDDLEISTGDKHYDDQELPEDMPTILTDMIDTKNDFASRAHCLVRWYNHRRFITLTPQDDYMIANENRVKILLGSASVALANIECSVPIFIQLRHPRSNFFQGISEHSNIRTMYEMVYFRQSSQKYQYLSELINLFREKTDCTLNDHISATIRLNYCLEDFKIYTEGQDRADFADKEMMLPSFSRTWQNELGNLVTKVQKATESLSTIAKERRFYAQFQTALKQLTQNQNNSGILKYLHVGALWPPMSDKVISDTPVHSDLNPTEAPIWTIRAVCRDNCPNSIASVVGELLDLSIQQADASIMDVIRAILLVSCSVINEKFKNYISELNEINDEILSNHEYLEPDHLLERLQKREYNGIYYILLRYEKQLYEIQAINELFSKAITYLYEKIDGAKELDSTAFELRRKCQLLSYKLSIQPETILSDDPDDDTRKLVAILFERQKYHREQIMRDSSPSLASTTIRSGLRDESDKELAGDHVISRSYRNFGTDNNPSVREFILRSNVSRPFSSGITSALPQRMFCTISDDEFRLCGAFSEMCN